MLSSRNGRLVLTAYDSEGTRGGIEVRGPSDMQHILYGDVSVVMACRLL
jgi:hypothetical protein